MALKKKNTSQHRQPIHMFSNSNTASSKHSSTSSAISTTTSPLSKEAHVNQKNLYAGLSSEATARMSIYNAFVASPTQLLDQYSVKRVIGFGTNGVVLAATHGSGAVAIKIIYKHKPSVNAAVPAEIEILKHLSAADSSSHILKYIQDWQDQYHFYLVTELFGSNWLSSVGESDASATPLRFGITHNGVTRHVHLPISTGASDLWAWSYAHRAHLAATEGHSMLPLHPVKQIAKKVASALAEMHAKGFYHGDVKIENVLVQSSSASQADKKKLPGQQQQQQQQQQRGPQVRLADFGHAKHASFGIRQYGTLEVAAPEFLADSRFATNELDGRAADVFALGMVLYMMLNATGEVPFAVKQVMAGKVGYEGLVSSDYGNFPLDDVSDLDDEAWDVLFAMTRVDPSARATIDQVLAHPFFSHP